MKSLVLSLVFLLLTVPRLDSYHSIGPPESADPESPSATLSSLINAGRLDVMSRPDFASIRRLIDAFYRPSSYALAWTTSGSPTPQARQLISVLQTSWKEGLRPSDYDGPLWEDRLRYQTQQRPEVSAAHLAAFDLALTVNALRYISTLYQGRIDPRELKFNLNACAEPFSPADFLRSRVVNATDVAAAMAEVEPPFPAYRLTRAALQRYLQLAGEGEGDPLIKPAKPLKPGSPYAGVPQLAARLRRLGDLPENALLPADSTIYSGVLVEAVKRFQERHGLSPDGILAPPTFQQLTVPFSRRVVQLQLALERLRWVRRDLKEPVVVVNIPEFKLRAYSGSHLDLHMSVIVGKDFRAQRTPVFEDEVESIIFSPYWYVPNSIARNELIPRLRRDPGYLARHEFQIVTNEGRVVSSGSPGQQLLQMVAAGTLRIRQRPGALNALGHIKFVFPNQYSVYLHGTPAEELFLQQKRTFSHGCIRIADPVALARWLLRDDPSWTLERMQEAMASPVPREVRLRRHVTVLIFYATALVEDDGRVRFFNDVYGYDAALEKTLAAR